MATMRAALPPVGTAERPLGVGATFATVVLAFVAGQLIGGALFLGGALLISLLTHGSVGQLLGAGDDQLMAHPIVICAAACSAGGTLVLATLLALRHARVPFRAGTGLVPPRVWHVLIAVLLVMTTGPFADLAVRAVRTLFPGLTLGVLESLGEAARTEGPMLVLVFVSVSLVPGIAEEIFFRGVIQRSLVGRFGGPLGVLIASLLFGAFHVDPPQALGAAVIGLSLGFVTWRTGSLIPAMVAHAANNAFALWASRAAGGETADELDLTTHATVVGISGAILVPCVFLLLRMTPQPPARSAA